MSNSGIISSMKNRSFFNIDDCSLYEFIEKYSNNEIQSYNIRDLFLKIANIQGGKFTVWNEKYNSILNDLVNTYSELEKKKLEQKAKTSAEENKNKIVNAIANSDIEFNDVWKMLQKIINFNAFNEKLQKQNLGVSLLDSKQVLEDDKKFSRIVKNALKNRSRGNLPECHWNIYNNTGYLDRQLFRSLCGEHSIGNVSFSIDADLCRLYFDDTADQSDPKNKSRYILFFNKGDFSHFAI